jgi:hypothetical protein
MMMRRDRRGLAWLLILSAFFWVPVALRSYDDGPPRSTESLPNKEK